MLEASLNQIEQLVSDLMQKNAQLTEQNTALGQELAQAKDCLLYTSPSPRDRQKSRMPSSA